ncbi:MAG: hypothetical protein DI606_19165 [Sphingobium sp.]|uniref:DUF3597 domain-containing protein n=1 Tax=Sphingobium sp. TaxID=1912891 RepID=UPI000DB84A68|nr:DUF3597 domain-containing protein [Sphingobium sp.]PZU05730.1 MAG: hypothetical protein DI606_19165 [Sphingobium sp.]PZU77947.1 MAG: hypothetical protein DI546_04710 [Rhizobium sp.]
MGIFSSIKDKIFGHRSKPAAPAANQAPAPTPAPVEPVTTPTPAPSTSPAAVAPAPVDVGAVLSEMAEMKGGGGNYQSSIVDLLKLLDLDSSLAARKELAEELHVHAGEHGSAEQNIALHKAVIAELEKNGGIVPDSLRN